MQNLIPRADVYRIEIDAKAGRGYGCAVVNTVPIRTQGYTCPRGRFGGARELARNRSAQPASGVGRGPLIREEAVR